MKIITIVMCCLVTIESYGQFCSGLVFDINEELRNSNNELIKGVLIPPKFLVEGDMNYVNGIEVLNAGANGLVICSPSYAGIYSTNANTYSAYLTNNPSAMTPAVFLGHGDEDKMDLQLWGVGRTAGEDGYVINIDTDQDGDESFLITDGGGTNLFRVRESDGTFTKNLGVQGSAIIDNYLSINGSNVYGNASMTLNSTSSSPVSSPMLAYAGLWGTWLTFVGTDGDLFFRADHTSNTMWLDQDGSGLISASDQRIKKSVTPLNNILSKVEQLKPSRYLYNHMQSNEVPIIGLMAQELQKYFPEVVEYSEDTDQYGVNYGQVSVIAIQAIKEQQKEIQLLKNQLEQLESKLSALLTSE